MVSFADPSRTPQASFPDHTLQLLAATQVFLLQYLKTFSETVLSDVIIKQGVLEWPCKAEWGAP